MTEKSNETLLSKCKICGAPARFLHFGVLSCQPCKMFFKRYAEIEQSTLKCDYDGQCEISINNRHVCASCRLAKCFRSGMDMALFRPSYPRRTKKKPQSKNQKSVSTSTDLIKLVNQTPTQLLPTLNLLRTDVSTLTNDQWILLSNLVHSYDERKMSPICRRMIQEDEYSHSMKPFDETLVKEFFTLFYETSESCLRSNGDLQNLSANDRSIILRTGADCVTCFGGAFTMYQSQLNTCQSFLNMLYTIYGEYNLALTLNSLKFVDPDMTLTKMAPLLLLFSINTCIFSSIIPLVHESPGAILQIQNKYAEVIWKYLLYRYGSYEAVQRFMHLIQFLLALTQTISHLQSVRSHVNDIEVVAENTELKLVLDDIEQIDEMTTTTDQ